MKYQPVRHKSTFKITPAMIPVDFTKEKFLLWPYLGLKVPRGAKSSQLDIGIIKALIILNHPHIKIPIRHIIFLPTFTQFTLPTQIGSTWPPFLQLSLKLEGKKVTKRPFSATMSHALCNASPHHEEFIFMSPSSNLTLSPLTNLSLSHLQLIFQFICSNIAQWASHSVTLYSKQCEIHHSTINNTHTQK